MIKDYTRGPGGEEPIWDWFGLSYASYSVLPRVALQSMPYEWQRQFIGLLEKLQAAFPDYESPAYAVFVRDEHGRLAVEPESVRAYRHNHWKLAPEPADLEPDPRVAHEAQDVPDTEGEKHDELYDELDDVFDARGENE